MDFFSLARNMGKNISKILSSITLRNVLIMFNSLPRTHLKLLQKERLKKQQKQLMI